MTANDHRSTPDAASALGLLQQAQGAVLRAQRACRYGRFQHAELIAADARTQLRRAAELAEQSEDPDWLAHWRDQAAVAARQLTGFHLHQFGAAPEGLRPVADLVYERTQIEAEVGHQETEAKRKAEHAAWLAERLKANPARWHWPWQRAKRATQAAERADTQARAERLDAEARSAAEAAAQIRREHLFPIDKALHAELADLDSDAHHLASLTSGSAEIFCRFCSSEPGPKAHRIGAAESGTNPWCCDSCWDERLR